jgi:ACR3 family arsenite efflux pump ArsB
VSRLVLELYVFPSLDTLVLSDDRFPLKYLGIPLAAGAVTRLIMKRSLAVKNFDRFLKFFGPLALVGLL